MTWRGYIFIENLAMNGNQKRDLIDALRALGNQTHSRPNLITQYRARLDGEAAIIEAEFGDADLTIDRLKQYLANVFGIDPGTIDHDARVIKYGTVVTLSRTSTDYLRIGAFAGAGSTYRESRQAAVQYLVDFAGLWEPPEGNPREAPLWRIMGRTMIPAYTTALGERIWNTLRRDA